jgi:hypothetical protein
LGWLTEHILIEDRAINGRIRNQWNELLPKDELAAVEKVVSMMIMEVFKLKTCIVSDHYAGDEVGKRIIYRITYRSPEEKRLQVFLALEEQLVLRKVGEMLGINFKKVDKMVIEVTKQLSQQMMKHMARYIKLLGQNEFEEDHILTDEQFKQEFESGYPRYSCFLIREWGILHFV